MAVERNVENGSDSLTIGLGFVKHPAAIQNSLGNFSAIYLSYGLLGMYSWVNYVQG